MDAVVDQSLFETSNSLEEVNERNLLLGWDVEYRQLRAQEYRGRMSGADIGESSILVEDVTTRSEVVGEFDGGVVAILVAFNPANSGTSVQYVDFCANAFLLRLSGEINCITSENTQLGMWFVETEVFYRSWEMLAPGSDPFQFGYYGFIGIPPGCAELLYGNNERMLGGDYALSETEGEYISSVLAYFAELSQANSGGLISRPQMAVRTRMTKRAREYIEANLRQSIKLPELCGYAGASISTLSRTFREYYGMSPSAFIRWRRMYDCYERLQQAGPREKSVGEVMRACGIKHQGRFAREYWQFFGQTPKQTLGYLD